MSEELSFKQQIRGEIEEFCEEEGCNYDVDEVVLHARTKEINGDEVEVVEVRLKEEPKEEISFEVNEHWGITNFVPSLINDLVYISDHY